MLKYNQKGFIPGIPARDLTDEEVKQFGEKYLLSTRLYEKEEQEAPPKKKARKSTQESETWQE
jgi:hypothetical protein